MHASKLTLATLVATYLLILAGGIVHATGSSLACPDWPLCYGAAFPSMAGGVFFEHSHRLLASLVGTAMLVLTLLLVFGRWRRHPRMLAIGIATLTLEILQGVLMTVAVAAARPSDTVPMQAAAPPPAQILSLAWLLMLAITVLLAMMAPAEDKTPAVALLGLEVLILQALLGGVTVVMRLPPLVSTAHLAASLILFLTLLYLALALRADAASASMAAPAAVGGAGVGAGTRKAAKGTLEPPRGPLAVTVVALYLECVLGALVRHSGAGLACGDTLWTCAGTLLPQAGPAHLNFSHRVFALLVAALVILTTAHAKRQLKETAGWHWRAARLFASAAPTLVLLQILLGLLTVATHVSTPVVVAHLGVAALLLADLMALHVCLGPLGARLGFRAAAATVTASART